MELKQNLRLSLLLEIYGPLLTEKQLSAVKDYSDNDLSISELAQISSSSRQAVNDLLKRSISLLEQYEAKLHLLAKLDSARTLLSSIDKELSKKSPDLSVVKSKLNLVMENL